MSRIAFNLQRSEAGLVRTVRIRNAGPLFGRHDEVFVGPVVESDPGAFNPAGQLPSRPVAFSHWLGQYLLSALECHATKIAHVDTVVCRLSVCAYQVLVDEVAGLRNHQFDDGPSCINR